MPRECHNPKCIGSKKRLTSRKYKNKEKDPPSTSRRSSSDNSTSRNKRTQKPQSKSSRDGSKNSRTSFKELRDNKNKKRQVSRSTSGSSTSSRKLRTSTKSNTFGRVSGNSRDCKKQICTCRKERHGTRSGNSHGHANSRSTDPVERSRRRRKRSHRRRKKTSKRESDRPRRDCFATLCVCVRGRSSDELRACKCTSSHEIPSHREYSVKGGQEGTKRVTCKNVSKNDTQVGRYTDPSTSEKKSAFKFHSRELSAAKPNEERSVIIRGLHTVRRGIDRFSASAIRLVTRQQ
ncbi:PREDICTED: protein FAM133-like [Wasmannia auropunctata]|uniref:protein FAM133-like n=1 Tax=Wasmannia auropunctata TaxID=64793 RepID=UPI0005EDBA8F|nr:PREDICTED: protein FAM133-like [Wasmannia auropunctata]XP_011691757.1 PREDICTED: protein FAM133-like [Wasmannia auropunctata]